MESLRSGLWMGLLKHAGVCLFCRAFWQERRPLLAYTWGRLTGSPQDISPREHRVTRIPEGPVLTSSLKPGCQDARLPGLPPPLPPSSLLDCHPPTPPSVLLPFRSLSLSSRHLHVSLRPLPRPPLRGQSSSKMQIWPCHSAWSPSVTTQHSGQSKTHSLAFRTPRGMTEPFSLASFLSPSHQASFPLPYTEPSQCSHLRPPCFLPPVLTGKPASSAHTSFNSYSSVNSTLH